MHCRDFPFGMRVVLVVGIFFCGLNALLLSVSITAIVAMLSQTGVHAATYTLGGAIVGSLLTFVFTRITARANRKNDARDVALSLHAEIADRAARCLNDFLKPWQGLRTSDSDDNRVPPRVWVSKFRPVDPVVYPSVASKLGLLDPDTLFAVVQFYFRLGAVQREIDDILNDDNFFAQSKFAKVKKRLLRVADRFQDTLLAGELALRSLSVPGADRVERAASRAYPHVRDKGSHLRDELVANGKVN